MSGRQKEIKAPNASDHTQTKTKNTVIGALVALLEFDGRRLYHWKEHRLVLLFVPRFCLYDRC